MLAKPMLSLRDVAERLNLNYSTVNTMCLKGQLPAVKLGVWRVDPDELEAWINTKRNVALKVERPKVTARVDADDLLRMEDNPFLKARKRA